MQLGAELVHELAPARCTGEQVSADDDHGREEEEEVKSISSLFAQAEYHETLTNTFAFVH